MLSLGQWLCCPTAHRSLRHPSCAQWSVQPAHAARAPRNCMETRNGVCPCFLDAGFRALFPLPCPGCSSSSDPGPVPHAGALALQDLV